MSDSIRNIRTIARRELAGYFASPVAFVFIVIFLLLSGFFTFMVAGFFERGEAGLETFFTWHPWLYLFLVPAVGMRMWSEERRLGTIELLLTMPVTPWQAIVGKFLASWAVVALALVLTFPVVITVNYLGHPDNGVILAGYIGSLLMAGAYLAISARQIESACERPLGWLDAARDDATPSAAERAFLDLALMAWRATNSAGRRDLRAKVKDIVDCESATAQAKRGSA